MQFRFSLDVLFLIFSRTGERILNTRPRFCIFIRNNCRLFLEKSYNDRDFVILFSRATYITITPSKIIILLEMKEWSNFYIRRHKFLPYSLFISNSLESSNVKFCIKKDIDHPGLLLRQNRK